MATLHVEMTDGLDDAREQADNANFDNNNTRVNADANTAASGRWNGGMRFEGVGVLQGATINSATIDVNCFNTSNDDPHCDIHCEDVDNAADFSSTADVTGRTVTTASTFWDATGLGTGRVTSPNFASALQEVIDRGAATTAIVVIMKGRSDINQSFRIRSYDSSAAEAADLDVDYTAGMLARRGSMGGGIGRNIQNDGMTGGMSG